MSRQVDLILFRKDSCSVDNGTELLEHNGLVNVKTVKALIEIKSSFHSGDFEHITSWIKESIGDNKVPMGIIGVQAINNAEDTINALSKPEHNGDYIKGCIIGRRLKRSEVISRGYNNGENKFIDPNIIRWDLGDDTHERPEWYEINPNNNVKIFLDWLMQRLL